MASMVCTKFRSLLGWHSAHVGEIGTVLYEYRGNESCH
jgi:hypothetical protein